MIERVKVIEGVSRYLRQEVSSRAFRDWMVGVQLQCESERAAASGKKDAEKAQVAEELLSAIDALYAQFSDGHLPESCMRQELAKLVVSDQVQTQSLTVFYSYLKPLFASSLDNPEWGASDTSNELPISQSHSRTIPVAA